ncbi:MAG: hypothetical protein ABFD79_16600 [Phycisphaerales bacterium]
MIKEKNKSNICELMPEDDMLDSFENQTQAPKAAKKFNINNSILLDIITDQNRAKFVWQCVCASFGVLIVLAGFMYFNLYKSNENLEEKIVNFARLETSLAESKVEADRLKTQVFEANNELKTAKTELNKCKTESTKLQEELDTVSTQLKDLQDRNAEVAKILNGRLQKLSK